MGLEARYRRFTAEMLYVMASGQRIDTNKTPGFGEIIREVYLNPFEKKEKKPETAEEIKTYIVGKLEELLNGFAQAGGED